MIQPMVLLVFPLWTANSLYETFQFTKTILNCISCPDYLLLLFLIELSKLEIETYYLNK